MLDKDNKIDMVVSFDKAVLNEAQANNIEII
jgi:hypothetical protein